MGDPDQIVAREVGAVVERERDVERVVAGPSGEDGRRVASDRAEPLRRAAEVERSETAHRDPADRYAVPVGTAPSEGDRDRFPQDVRSPRPLGAIVPPANVSFWEQHDRRAVAEPPQRDQESRTEHVDRRSAVAVEKDEQRPSLAAPGRRDHHLVELPAHQLALQREVGDLGGGASSAFSDPQPQSAIAVSKTGSRSRT